MVQTVFYILGTAAVIAALMCITQRSPIASAFWLISCMLSLAGIYVLLDAHFIGALQVLVYAGAVMVLFLFVIMLLNLGREETDLRGRLSWLMALLVAAGLTATLAVLARYTPEQLALEISGTSQLAPGAVMPGGAELEAAVQQSGVVGALAGPMFQNYMIPFQITGLLLLVAIVGAVVLAKRRI